MPDRVTEADLARWEALAADTADVLDDYAIDLQHDVAMNDLRGLSRTAVPALVDEVRRLRRIIDLIGQSQSDVVQVNLYNAVVRASEAGADAEDA